MKSNLKKVISIFGTRPEAIKMAPVIKELENHRDRIQSIVCITAQHREMLDQVLKLFNIKCDYDLNIMKHDQSLFDLTSKAIKRLKEVLEKEKPDIVLIQGDTTTTFIAALAAFYLKIPIGHIEAGLRTYDKFNPFPEEINRHLTSVLADIHFAPTKTAKQILLKENISEKKIYVTGNTVIDALLKILDKKYKFDIPELKKIDFSKRIILITAHRRESFGRKFDQMCNAFKVIIKNNPDIEIVYPVHLNPNVQMPVMKIISNEERIHLIKPLDYMPFIHLMKRSYLILTDSGGIQEEAPSLGKPVLVMRNVSERLEGVSAGTVKVVGTDKKNIIKETQILLDSKEEYKRMSKAINPYGDGKASERIVEVLLTGKLQNQFSL